MHPQSPAYELTKWPPPEDWPVSADKSGEVISRIRDPFFDLTPYAERALRIRFDDKRISASNTTRLKQIVCWWLWGERGALNAISVYSYAITIKPVFLLCSKHNIDVCDLKEKPHLIAELATLVAKSRADTFLMLMDELFHAREQIGFVILDQKDLLRLSKQLPEHQLQQTAYIPPRIWLYQVQRLRACLDDFLTHQTALENLFLFCLDAYVKNYGSIEKACATGVRRDFGPFNSDMSWQHEYVGSFASVADKFGVNDLLRKWLRPHDGHQVNDDVSGIQRLTAYFNLVQAAGLAYILNFTAMRSAEGASLRASCLQTEEDEQFGAVYLIQGVTTKTVRDYSATWITSPSVSSAVRAMEAISWLRAQVASFDPNVRFDREFLEDPMLRMPSYEPWGILGSMARVRGPSARHVPGYSHIIEQYAALFDESQLTITAEDLHIAREITPGLNPEVYAVGKVWPLAFHQLRRTTAVNMVASGLVDLSSLQYQLKHLVRAQALYYGRGHSRLRLNQRSKEEYIRTVYEMLARQADNLKDARYVSPLGPKAKDRILNAVDGKDAKALLKSAKSGQLSIRETLLGLCMKRGPCPYGGIDNIAHCSSCPDALFDSKKEKAIRSLKVVVDNRLHKSPDDSPRRRSLMAQKSSILVALNAIKSK